LLLQQPQQLTELAAARLLAVQLLRLVLHWPVRWCLRGCLRSMMLS
jgi:hypothetical protein